MAALSGADYSFLQVSAQAVPEDNLAKELGQGKSGPSWQQATDDKKSTTNELLATGQVLLRVHGECECT